MSIQIHTLADNEKITEPGFYRMSLDRHHSQPCEGVSVTSGVLRRMLLKTPGDVWAFHQLNPERWEEEDSTAKRLGRLMAAYVEGGEEEVERLFYILPDNRPNRPTRVQYQAIKEGRGSKTAHAAVAFWREVDTDSRDQITETQMQMVRNMGMALAHDPAARAILGGEPEITMAWRDERTGLWCLARPDQLSFGGFISDYKKISPQGGTFNKSLCYRAIRAHRYDMQMALAWEGMERLTGHLSKEVGLLFQADVKPHFCIPIEIAEEELQIGKFYNHQSMLRFAECLDAGHWSEPGEEPGVFHWSDEERSRIVEEMQEQGVAL